MPDKWNSRWDQYCFLRANNPSKEGWAALALTLVGVLALAVVVYLSVVLYGG